MVLTCHRAWKLDRDGAMPSKPSICSKVGLGRSRQLSFPSRAVKTAHSRALDTAAWDGFCSAGTRGKGAMTQMRKAEGTLPSQPSCRSSSLGLGSRTGQRGHDNGCAEQELISELLRLSCTTKPFKGHCTIPKVCGAKNSPVACVNYHETGLVGSYAMSNEFLSPGWLSTGPGTSCSPIYCHIASNH